MKLGLESTPEQQLEAILAKGRRHLVKQRARIIRTPRFIVISTPNSPDDWLFDHFVSATAFNGEQVCWGDNTK